MCLQFATMKEKNCILQPANIINLLYILELENNCNFSVLAIFQLTIRKATCLKTKTKTDKLSFQSIQKNYDN